MDLSSQLTEATFLAGSWPSDGCKGSVLRGTAESNTAMEIGQLHQEMQAFCGQKHFLTRNIRNPYYSRRHSRQVVGKRKGLCNDVGMLLIKARGLEKCWRCEEFSA